MFAPKNAAHKIKSLCLANRRLVSLDDRLWGQELFQSSDDQLLLLFHPKSERLQDHIWSVSVDYKSREPVAFTPGNTSGVPIDSELFSKVDGLVESSRKKVQIQWLFAS